MLFYFYHFLFIQTIFQSAATNLLNIEFDISTGKVIAMKIKALITVLASAVLTACVAANASPEQNKDSDYRIQVFKECEKIKDIAMSPDQITAYQALQNIEDKMTQLEAPMRDMDEELEVYQDQLDELADAVTYEDDNVLKIDKQKLREQKQLARKIEQIVRHHEADIRAIESEARRIEAASMRFERAIKPSLDGLDHDQVQIINRKTAKPFKCYQMS